ncbi:DNA adenine methylase [Citrobacter freundii]|nr:DNA adenine methylase [Citrobacter freundii]
MTALNKQAPIKHPAIRYHGGKFRLASWLIEQMPEHTCYVEPFGGAAGVLLRRMVVRACMGFGSAAGIGGQSGFRSDSKRKYATAAHLWERYPENLAAICQRLQGVIIENKDALVVMRAHDAETTLHYIDPPYVPETRVQGNRYYNHEMTVEGHEQLLAVARTMTGMVMISGYDTEIYNDMLTGWTKTEKTSRISAGRGTKVRTECLWVNPVAQRKSSAAGIGVKGE